jgi:hypothetical protein
MLSYPSLTNVWRRTEDSSQNVMSNEALNTSPKVEQSDPVVSEQMTAIMVQVLRKLEEINDRQERLDSSDKPVRQMDARNPVAWRALEKSHNEIMEPEIERWKGGLDATLVFVRILHFH